MTDLTLFHYTCEHGYRSMGDGIVTLRVKGASGLIWATDLDVPFRDALGLTSNILNCDRTQHRYLIADAERFRPWHEYAHDKPSWFRDPLEQAPGAMPMHWWVSERPAIAHYAPLLPE